MSNRDPRFDPDRRPDAQPRRGADQQTNMRAHHSLERSPAYYDASHSDAYYPERYLQQALNWNNRDLTQTDSDHPEVQRQFSQQERQMHADRNRAYRDDYGPHSTTQPSESYRGRGPKGYIRSDERILEDVCDRLNRDSQVDASEILVTCSEGIVTLEGSVDSRATKRRAEDLADDCGGVRDVNNRLVISNL